MQRKLYLLFLLCLSTSGLYSQTSTDPWKWLVDYESTPIMLGEDTLTLSPSADAVPDNEWWEVFGYPLLDSLQKLATEGNFDLKIFQNRVKEAEERITLARASLLPVVQFNPSFFRQELSGNRPLGFDLDVPQVKINTYALPLDISYEIDIFGKNINRLKGSRYDYGATEASQKGLLLNVTATVARNFFLLIALDTENRILQRTLLTRQDNLEIVEIRFRAGLVNEIDLQRARTELSSVEVQLRENERQRTEAELILATLCGQSPSEFVIGETEIRYLAPRITLKGKESLKQSRPDLLEADFLIRSSEELLKASRKSLYPSLFLDGSFGYLSGSSGDLFEGVSRTWLLGGTLSVPLFEGNRRKAGLKIGNYQLEASRQIFEQRQIEAHQEVENALSNLYQLHEQLLAQQTFLQASQQAALLSNERYRKGLVTYLEVVDAERIVLEAERLSVQLFVQELLNTVTLIEALGG